MTAAQIRDRRRRRLLAVVPVAVLVFTAAAVGIGSVGPAAAASATIVMSPTDDAYAAEVTPSQNFGAAADLVVGIVSQNAKKSYLRFDVSGIPTGATVNSATLRLTATNSTSTPIKLRPVSVSPAWSESTLTWSNRPAYTGTTSLPSSPSRVVAGPVTFNVTTLVTANGVVGFGLLQGGTVAADQFFSSKEGPAPSELDVVYTPQPSPTPSPTFPVDPADPVLLAAGDISCDSSDPRYNNGLGTSSACQQQATSDVVTNEIAATSAPSTVLALGDNQYDCGALSDFQQAYDPTWGRFKSITAPVPGNHEYKSGNPNAFGETECTKGASGYYNYFGSAAHGSTAGYYSFNVGSWHLIALNTNSGCTKVSCGQGSVQEQWLRADLAANTQPCTLAFWHEPAFSSKGDSASTLAFWQDLYAAHADLVVNGHIHGYERFAPLDPAGNPDPNGIREIVAGTGGEDHAGFGSTTRVGSEAKNATTFGVLKLVLHSTAYEFSFLPVPGQAYVDSGAALCKAK